LPQVLAGRGTSRLDSTGNLMSGWWRTAAAACAAIAAAACAHAASDLPPRTAATPVAASAPQQAASHARPRLDLSGRTRIGKASFYAGKFSGRKMADGSRMDPRDDSAASKTLPLGTTAKVTNLETGESAVVTIRDRGPHVQGRIVDLTPATAQKVGIDRHEGVSKVAVTPISMPPSDQAAKPHDMAPDTKTARPRPDSTSAPR
jgi:rare lipoprotein A